MLANEFLSGFRSWIVVVLAHEFLDSVLRLALTSYKNDGLTEVFVQIETNAVISDTGMRYCAGSVNTEAPKS